MRYQLWTCHVHPIQFSSIQLMCRIDRVVGTYSSSIHRLSTNYSGLSEKPVDPWMAGLLIIYTDILSATGLIILLLLHWNTLSLKIFSNYYTLNIFSERFERKFIVIALTFVMNYPFASYQITVTCSWVLKF